MADKTHGYGTKLQYDADGTPPFTDLTDLRGVTPPNPERGEAEITHLESAGMAREYMASWINTGEVPFTGYYTKAQFNTLLGFLAAGTTYYWRVLFPLIGAEATNGYVAFQGFVKKVGFDEITTEDDGTIKCPFTIKTTGSMTHVPAT